MSEPALRPGRLLILLALCGWLLVMLIAFADGPDPSRGFQVIVAVHDSLIPPRASWDPDPQRPPTLVGTLTTRDAGTELSTWMFSHHGRAASVHRLERSLDPPPQARMLRAQEPELWTFELADLTLLVWAERGATWVVAGSDDVAGLRELEAQVRSRGMAFLSPARAPDPAASGAAGSASPEPR